MLSTDEAKQRATERRAQSPFGIGAACVRELTTPDRYGGRVWEVLITDDGERFAHINGLIHGNEDRADEYVEEATEEFAGRFPEADRYGGLLQYAESKKPEPMSLDMS